MPQQPKANAKDIAARIAGTRLGKCFNDNERLFLSEFMRLREFEPGENIFEEGEHSDHLAVVTVGEVEITKESDDAMETRVITFRAGGHFGDMSFIDGEPRSAAARAKTPATLALLAPDDLERILAIRPEVGIKVLMFLTRTISNRLRMTTNRLVDAG